MVPQWYGWESVNEMHSSRGGYVWTGPGKEGEGMLYSNSCVQQR